MVDRKSGPVKPPVLDLKAREAEKQTQEDAKTDAQPAAAGGAARAPSGGAEPAGPGETPSTKGAGADAPAPAGQSGTVAGGQAASSGSAASGAGSTSPRREAPATAPGARASRPEPTPDSQSGAAPARRAGASPGQLGLAALGGGVIGAGLIVALAAGGLLPLGAQTDEAVTAQVAALEGRLSTLEAGQPDPDALVAATRDALAPEIAQANAPVADLSARVDALAATLEAEGPGDTEDLRQDLVALSDRVDAIQSGASAEDAEALAADLAASRAALGEVSGRIDALSGALDAISAEQQQAGQRMDTLEAQMSDQAASAALRDELSRLAAVPALVGAVDAHMAGGTPFAAELSELSALLPEIPVPPELDSRADAGLMAPAALAARFNAVIPALLSAGPPDPDANWGQSMVSQVQAALALRPVGAVEGEGPEARVARIEAALERRDYAQALFEIDALSPPVPAELDAVRDDIAARSAAAAYLDAARGAFSGSASSGAEPGA